MRRLVWVLPVLPVLPLACFNPGSPITVTFEAGGLPEIEFGDATAALPDVSLFPLPEAGPLPEAAVEAEAEAAPPVGTAKATVVSDFGPEQGVTLLITDSHGVPLAAPVQTDATGVAQFPAPEGACVTAILGSTNNGYSVVTYMAVAPGDNLTILDTTDVPQGGFIVDVTNVPTGPGTQYAGYFPGISVGPCNQQTEFWYDHSVSQGCYAGGVFPLFVLLPGNETYTAYTFRKGNSLGPLLVDGGNDQVTVDLTGATVYTDMSMQTVTAVNPPASLARYGVYLSYSEVANNLPSAAGGIQVAFDPDGGTASTSFNSYPSYPDFVQSQAEIFPQNGYGGGNGSPYVAVAQRHTGKPTGSQTLDLSGLPPLTVSANVLNGSSSASIAWSTSSPDTSTIGTLVRISGCGSSWTFVVPPGVDAISSFELPPALLSALFTGECSIRYNVEIIGGDSIADYTSLKQVSDVMVELMENPGVGGCGGSGLPMPPLPNDGDLTVSGYEYGYFFGCS